MPTDTPDAPDSPYRLEPVSREWLLQTIAFALRHKVRLPMVGPRKARWKDDHESQAAAQAIIDQLELSGINLARKVERFVPNRHLPFGPDRDGRDEPTK